MSERKEINSVTHICGGRTIATGTKVMSLSLLHDAMSYLAGFCLCFTAPKRERHGGVAKSKKAIMRIICETENVLCISGVRSLLVLTRRENKRERERERMRGKKKGGIISG